MPADLRENREIEREEKMKTLAIALAASFAILSAAAAEKASAATTNAPAASAKAPADKIVKATIMTSKGEIGLELNATKAPETVRNFVAYANESHYQGTVFHRVIDGFMIQGGGYTLDMGEKSTNEPIRNEAANGLKNLRGTIAMARTSEVDSATSQFFINLKDNPQLDHRGKRASEFGYCVFGKVVSGMDVVDQIAKVATGDRGVHRNVPTEPVMIMQVSVEE